MLHLRLLLTLFSMLFLSDAGESGDDGDGEAGDGDADGEKVTFTEAQQAAINAMIARERKSAEARTAERLKADADKARLKADQDAQRKKDEEAGEFEKVKASLTEERDTAISERDSLSDRLDKALAVITADITSRWDAVPQEVRDLYDGADDDVLAKSAFLTRPATANLIDRLATESPRGNPPGRKPTKPKIETPPLVNPSTAW